MTIRIDCRDGANRERAISLALSTIRRGGLLVMPTESVYAIVTDAFNSRGTSALRQLKGFDSLVPLSVLVPHATTVAGITRRVSPAATSLMEALWPGELTLLLEAGSTLSWDHPLAAPVAVRMPLHPLALAVLDTVGPVASTSAALGGNPPITTPQGLVECERDEIAVILDAGDLSDRAPSARASTVVDCTVEPPVIVRPGACSSETLRSVTPEIA
ncbi:MAG: threonylcarbamoyl-AMP synthase [Candidatus Nanopelagicales bacterium]|nr:threonylcarbamoyl-AMP synthase [Candidatus Nanopelagicales bacterium]MCF8539451.1 threonylcarbamoyl-AMP synthase [Candidatus Nanopelagicales bacterium]